MNGIRYNCAGSTGICTVSASVLPLADGELAFLKDGRPEIEPGAFPDGFYLRDGNIYAAYRGYLLHVEKLCRLSGIYFDCAGASGVCKVRADALTLADGELILLSSDKVVFRGRIGEFSASELMSLEGVILEGPDLEQNGKRRRVVAYYTDFYHRVTK